MNIFEGNGWTITVRRDQMVFTIKRPKGWCPNLKYLKGARLREFVQKYKDLSIDKFLKKVAAYHHVEIDGQGWICEINEDHLRIEHHEGGFEEYRVPVYLKKHIEQLLSESSRRLYHTVVNLLDDELVVGKS